MQVVTASPHPFWLRKQVAALRGTDPLAPVTVILGGRASAVAVHRSLAREGTINTRCTVLGSVAEALGTPLAASEGLRPAGAVVQLAVVRELVRRAPPPLGGANAHRATVASVAAGIRRLRDRQLSGEDRQVLAGRGELPATLISLLDAWEQALSKHRLYDSAGLFGFAVRAVGEGASLRELGPVLVNLPRDLPEHHRALITALAARTPVTISLLDSGPPEARAATERLSRVLRGSDAPGGNGQHGYLAPATRITTAPSATEEVRIALRQILADCEAGVALHRMAVLHNHDLSYRPALHDALAAAGIPSTVLGGRPLAESHAARGLLGLLNLPHRDFSRIAVVTWLASFPHPRRDGPDAPVWDRLSRRAGVVRGAANWQERMRALARRHRAGAGDSDDRSETSESQRAAWLHEADNCDAIAERISALAEATRAPAEPTWTALSAWAAGLLSGHVIDDRWPAEETEAGRLVAEVVAALAAGEQVEASVSPQVLIDTLEAILGERRQPQGRLGDGVVTGPLAAAAGMAFARVHILGMTESAFPSRPSADPLLPASGPDDPFDEGEQRVGAEALAFATICAGLEEGGVVHLSTPTWDPSGRPVHASRWLVAAASRLAGQPLTSDGLRELPSSQWLTAVPSTLAGVRRAPAPLTVAERRLQAVEGWHDQGLAVGDSVLAARDDLPLGRALAIQAARSSDLLTAADGNLADRSLDPGYDRAISTRDYVSGGVQSATRLQEWATCPFRFFLNRILGVEPTGQPEDEDRWTVSALDRGSTVHRILERFFAELGAAGRPATASEGFTAADRVRLAVIAAEVMDSLEEHGLTGHPLVWSAARAAILADLETLLERDTEERGRGGWLPALQEQGFGYGTTRSPGWEAVAMTLPDGGTLVLRGSIDRVDLAPSRSTPRSARIIDYKTGRARPTGADLARDPVRAGTALQLALYARAVRQAYPLLSVVEAAYWYVSTKGGFTLASAEMDDQADQRLSEVLTAIAAGITGGGFRQAPGEETMRPGRTGWDNCIYCDFDRVCPSGRDVVQERKSQDVAARFHTSLTTPGGEGP